MGAVDLKGQFGVKSTVYMAKQMLIVEFVCARQGAEVVPQLQSGDMITNARLLSGDNHLVLHENQC